MIHDSADPAGILRAIHDALEPTGRYVCVDINCAENPEDNIGPLGTVLYGSSLATACRCHSPPVALDLAPSD